MTEKKEKKGRALRIVLDIIIVILLCVLAYAGYHLYEIWSMYHHGSEVREDMQKLIYTEVETEDGEEIEFKGIEDMKEYDVSPDDVLAKLREVNPDVVGWIHVEDTTIDYPIVQTTDNKYYLNHNIYKEYTPVGNVFMDYKNTPGVPLQNIILYGHRMKDDSQFGHISKFLNKDFFKEHPTFSVILQDGYYECEVFAVYQTTTYGFEYNITGPFPDEETYTDFIERCRNMSKFPTDVEITPEDNIITLSTCDYQLDVNEGRLVLQAKMTKISSEKTS